MHDALDGLALAVIYAAASAYAHLCRRPKPCIAVLARSQRHDVMFVKVDGNAAVHDLQQHPNAIRASELFEHAQLFSGRTAKSDVPAARA